MKQPSKSWTIKDLDDQVVATYTEWEHAEKAATAKSLELGEVHVWLTRLMGSVPVTSGPSIWVNGEWQGDLYNGK